MTQGVWQCGAEGGAEHVVPELAAVGYWRAWELGPKGIYFVSQEQESGAYPIKLWGFGSGNFRTLLAVPHEPMRLQPGLSVSRDGQSILFTQLDSDVNDIMLIDNFR